MFSFEKFSIFPAIRQRFSNYGPRNTCGPRGMPLWPLTKCRRKIKIQMNWLSHYSWKSQSLLMTHGFRLSFFSQYRHFMKFITLPINRLPTLLSETKQGYKTLWTWCFPCTSGAAPVTQPWTTRIRNRGPKYRTFSCIYDFLDSFAHTQSAHWNGQVLYVHHTPIIELPNCI